MQVVIIGSGVAGLTAGGYLARSGCKVKIFEEVRVEMSNQIGKRYVCKKCGSEFIVTRGGDGTIVCCGQPMELKQ